MCTVRLDGGHEVKAVKVIEGGAGARTTLSIRPERVQIDPDPRKIANVLLGEIRELVFLGDHMRVHMHVAGSDEFVVKINNRISSLSLREVQGAKVGWYPEDCRALDERPG
jgi:putative spermidine/putrescine transport system ATP-binding protein